MTVLPHTQPLHRLPDQAPDLPWPAEEWSVGPLPEGVSIDGLIEEAFDPSGPLYQTYAVAIVHRGGWSSNATTDSCPSGTSRASR